MLLSQSAKARRTSSLFHQFGDTGDDTEAARALNQRCYPHTLNSGISWFLNSSLSLSVGFSIQLVAMNVDWSAPQGAHYHMDVICSLP